MTAGMRSGDRDSARMVYARSPRDVTSGSPQEVGLRRRLLHWILPCPCLECGSAVWEPRSSLGLCRRCRRSLVPWPGAGCESCGRLLDAARRSSGSCSSCRERRPSYDRALSTWCYLPPLDKVMMALKFRRLDYLGEQLGRAMAEIHRGEVPDCEMIAAIPLYWTRFLHRGYNQAALIARPLAHGLGLPLLRPLARRRPTPHQTRLARGARQENLERAFVVRGAAGISGRRILLVDDVTTTGATLEAAAACLRQAGAKSVVALTAARTPTAAERSRLAALSGRAPLW